MADRAEYPLTLLNHDVAAHITVQSAADDSVGIISEPKTLSMVSETVDTAIAVQSAYATAENVVAYYAPLGQALELVDHLLNAVSTLAEVSGFYRQMYVYSNLYSGSFYCQDHLSGVVVGLLGGSLFFLQ
jgi:hypothetical protein